jgi:hypothetical protein
MPPMLTSRRFVSGLILAVLLLQGSATFFSIGSALWPFTNYPMYDAAVKHGVRVNRYSLYAAFDSSDDRTVSPEELGLTRFQFDKAVVPFLLSYRGGASARKKLLDYAALYSRWHKGRARPIQAFRLENKPLVFTPRGFEPAPSRTATAYLQDQGEDAP